MSENGPREGTQDLPRRDRDVGHRAVGPGTPAGAAYASLGRAARRRREELLGLIQQGLSVPAVSARYRREHPLEPEVTPDEIHALLRSR
ncbi:MAG TPA: hypothetical protein VEK13_05340 [Thermoplasmata archaeon]|nr:hypothetical protein [Thermoplasmata archaeon]